MWRTSTCGCRCAPRFPPPAPTGRATLTLGLPAPACLAQRSVQGKIDAVLTDMEDVGELDDLPDEVALTLGGLGVRYVRTLQKEYKEFLLNKAASAEDEENESKRMVFRPFQLEGDPMDQELRYGRRLRHEGMITERTRASEALLRSAMEKDAARLWRYDQSGARRIFTPDGERLGDRPQWQYDVAVPYAGLTDREVAMATEVGTRELLTERCARRCGRVQWLRWPSPDATAAGCSPSP